jgi:hypothetical protein
LMVGTRTKRFDSVELIILVCFRGCLWGALAIEFVGGKEIIRFCQYHSYLCVSELLKGLGPYC